LVIYVLFSFMDLLLKLRMTTERVPTATLAISLRTANHRARIIVSGVRVSLRLSTLKSHRNWAQTGSAESVKSFAWRWSRPGDFGNRSRLTLDPNYAVSARQHA
jgi:hypothetical protein